MLAAFWILPATAIAADWPQLQCDAAKSGFQPLEVVYTGGHTSNGGYGAARWSWSPPGGAGAATGGTTSGGILSGQPVVGEGVVAIGAVSGHVYALSETGGQALWTRDLGTPVLNSPAIVNGLVIVATQDGRVLGLNKNSGSTIWTYTAQKGFAAAPTVYQSRVYIGSKDGVFHCVDSQSGQNVWTFQVGGPQDSGATRAPIICSAAVRDGQVFFGAENLHAYALSADTGVRRWRRALNGQSFHKSWAVASSQAGGVVIFRTKPVYVFHSLLDDDERYIMAQSGVNGSGNPLGNQNAWITEQRAISQRLEGNPHLRSLWALNAATGNDRYSQPSPVLWTGGSGGTPAAPPVGDTLGQAWITLRSVYARFDGMGIRMFGELARLNLDFDPAIYTDSSQGKLGFDYFPCMGDTNCKEAWEDFHKIADEGETLTACQNAVFSSTWVSDGGIDLATGRTFNVKMYSSDDTGGASVYGSGEGVVVANGRVFLRDSEGIKCYAR